jgi:hypothetical protein
MDGRDRSNSLSISRWQESVEFSCNN